LYSPSENQLGSWVAMAFDDKGRMIASDQYGALYRLQLPPVGSSGMPMIEKLKIGQSDPSDTVEVVKMGYAQGLLYAFNSLFVMVNNRVNENFEKTSGLYRLEDTTGDDQYDKITLLKTLKGDGEHGPHSVKLSPDGKSLYVIAGNHTDVPPMDAYRLPANWQEDNIFPLIKDPRGHANDRLAPGGWIAKVDPETNHWELVSAGFRNAFDIAFDEYGEMFAYDSDMEWDFGMPWYRPTRICHVTSGSEFGWRTGNSKWPADYPDNLPAMINIGQGSPTNLVHGTDSNFPEKYRESLFAFDWSFGIIYAIQIQPKGATFTANAEEFISGAPLPLTDGVFGPDGALYFLTGGRRLESDLYRISFVGKDSQVKQASIQDNNSRKLVNEAAALRRSLENYHGKSDKNALGFIWPNLKHEDRFVRYAARIALEHQPLSDWQSKALVETDPQILIQAMIALARTGKKEMKNSMVTALTKINFSLLTENQQGELLRAFELVVARMGKPEGAAKNKLNNYLLPHYPASSNALNRSLSTILTHLDAPGVVEKTLILLETASDDQNELTVSNSSDLILRNPQYGLDIARLLAKMPPAQQTHYAIVLSQTKSGWTDELRERYFKWFNNAFSYKGGVSYVGFINKARLAALENVPKEKYAYYSKASGEELLTKSGNDIAEFPSAKGPWRNWKLEDATAVLDEGLVSRDYENGKKMYAATRCVSCHSMSGEGGSIGPDLTRIGTRFSAKDMLEHIILPNKEVSDQYAATVYTMKDGSSIFGRQINEDKDKYYISQNPFDPEVIREIPKKDVSGTKYSRISVMMPGLINSLNPEELKDLIAYLVAGGNEEHEVFVGK
jgi:putative heme-binding domain-containing protein